MSIWNDVYDGSAIAAAARLLAILERSDELNALLASAEVDKLAGAKGPEAKAQARKAKAARQTLQNPLGGTASLAQSERDLTKSLNTLLKEHGSQLAAMASVLVEFWITKSQIDDVREAREAVKATKAGPRASAQERGVLDALYAAGCTLWQLRQLAQGDVRYIAAFVAEKAEDPHHRQASGLAMEAFRAGHLELAVEGLSEDEQMALLLAAGRITDADIAAKRAFEAAAGRPLRLSSTLAGALARAADLRRIDGTWPGATWTVDQAEDDGFNRDLQTLVEAMCDGEDVDRRAWDILLPSAPSIDNVVHQAEVQPGACGEIARQMLDHVHGDEEDRWKKVMTQASHDASTRRLMIERISAAAAGSPLARDDWRSIIMADDWQKALRRCQEADVMELAELVRDRPEIRWLATMRGIDVPAGLTVEPPFLRAAQLLRQPVEEIIWEMFDPPLQDAPYRATDAGEAPPIDLSPTHGRHTVHDDDY